MTVFAEENINIEFIVVIDGVEQSVDELNLRPDEYIEVTARITPEPTEPIFWSQTAVAGFNLAKNGNKVRIHIADDMPIGRTYDLILSCGDFSKFLKVNIVADHTCSYTEEITKEATCAETGIKTFTCSCGNSYTEEIPTGNHTEVIDAAKVATCTETGLTEGKHCLVCNEILVAQEEIPIAGHNYIETVTDATCTANGNKHYECDVCGDSYDETITSNGHTYEEGNYTIDKAATCEETGSKSVHCEVCDAIIDGTSVEIEATGHTYTEGKYIVDIEPTPQKNGSKSIHCDICDEIIEGTSVEIEYVEPDVIEEVIVTFDPNCSSLKTETITINKGDKINKIPTIKRTDYKFLGWYTKDNSKLTTETIILEDITYFAKWEKIKQSEDKPIDKPVDSPVDKPSNNPPSEDIKDKTDESSNTKPEDSTNNSSNDTSKDDNPSNNKSEDTTNKLPINNQEENTSDLSGNDLKNNSDNSPDDSSGNYTDISSDNSTKSDIGNSTNSNSGSKSNNSNSNIKTTSSKSSGNTTVKKRMFFIGFNCTGGTTENCEHRNTDNYISCGFYVEEGNPLGELPIPTKKGYIFDCWQDIKNNKIDENTIPVRNTTYYAKWIKE